MTKYLISVTHMFPVDQKYFGTERSRSLQPLATLQAKHIELYSITIESNARLVFAVPDPHFMFFFHSSASRNMPKQHLAQWKHFLQLRCPLLPTTCTQSHLLWNSILGMRIPIILNMPKTCILPHPFWNLCHIGGAHHIGNRNLVNNFTLCWSH